MRWAAAARVCHDEQPQKAQQQCNMLILHKTRLATRPSPLTRLLLDARVLSFNLLSHHPTPKPYSLTQTKVRRVEQPAPPNPCLPCLTSGALVPTNEPLFRTDG